MVKYICLFFTILFFSLTTYKFYAQEISHPTEKILHYKIVEKKEGEKIKQIEWTKIARNADNKPVQFDPKSQETKTIIIKGKFYVDTTHVYMEYYNMNLFKNTLFEPMKDIYSFHYPQSQLIINFEGVVRFPEEAKDSIEQYLKENFTLNTTISFYDKDTTYQFEKNLLLAIFKFSHDSAKTEPRWTTIDTISAEQIIECKNTNIKYIQIEETQIEKSKEKLSLLPPKHDICKTNWERCLKIISRAIFAALLSYTVKEIVTINNSPKKIPNAPDFPRH